MKNIVAKFYIIGLVFAVGVPLQSIAADWTDESGNEYTALKSVKGTAKGSQVDGGWFVIDFKPTGKEKVKMHFKLPEGAHLPQFLWCNRAKSTASQYPRFGAFCSGNRTIMVVRNTSGTIEGDAKLDANYCTLVVDYANREFYVNGIKQSKSLPEGGFGTPGNIPDNTLLFASNIQGNSGSKISEDMEAKYVQSRGSYYLYGFQIYDSENKLMRNFVPAMRDSDEVVGLYDTTTQKFYPPAQKSATAFIGERWGNDRAGKKWTGLGGDNKMSTAANWANNDKPEEGDDIDFTIAVPNAEIVADIDVTFGKVYLGTGDIPKFTGALSATAINDLPKMQAYDTAEDGFTFTLAAPIGQDFTWNGAEEANWWAANAWDYNTAASVWYDNNTAVFNTANATATLNANVTAESVVFGKDATIVTNGTDAATLTVPTVSVAQNVSATIDAPIAGALVKTGAGTLTLKSSRSEATTLSEGMLVFSGNDTKLDWSKLTLGNDPAKPVTLRFEDGAALASESAACNFGNVAGITSTICKSGGDWTRSGTTRIDPAADANTTFVNESGDLIFKDYFTVGARADANATGSSELAIAGGKVAVSGKTGTQWVSVGSYGPGIVTVTNNAAFEVTRSIAFSLHSGSGTLNVSDGGTATIGVDIIFGSTQDDAGTGTVNIGRRGTVIVASIKCESYGRGIVNFDGGTLKAGENAGKEGKPLIQPSERMTVNVFENGGIIDNNSHNITNSCTIGGVGGMTFSGSGTTTISVNQEYTGTTTVSAGTTLSVSGGITFAGDVEFAAGSKFDIANYVGGVNPVTAKSFTFPDSGTVPLTLNSGSFIAGAYAICKASLVSAEQARLSFAPSSGDLGYSWDVSATGDLLLLVGDIHGYSWTGLAGDNKFANGGNWVNGSAPGANGSVDFSAVSSNISIDMEGVPEGTTFGEVTMGTGVITFTGEFAATSFSDTSKIAVGENSTVTLDGDLEFGVDGNAYICYSVAEGGKFEVTGDIITTPKQTKSLLPCFLPVNKGVISAKGLVTRNSNDIFALSWFENNAFAKWLIGENGICGTGTGAFFVGDKPGGQATIIAATDFVVSAHIISWRNLTFDTAGYTVTLGTNTLAKSGGISGNTASVTRSIEVRGAGKVVVNYNVNDLTTDPDSRNNAFTVTDGATLSLKPGANIGTGLLTIKGGAALEIPESGMVTHNGNLSLETGAALAFNFTDRRVAPQIAVAQGKSVTVSGAVKVKVSGDVWPIGGDYVLTACGGFNAEGVSLADGAPKWAKGIGVNEDGNIVLTVRPKSTMIIVR